MPAKAKPIPAEYPGATPYLCIKGAARAIDFYVKAFGATEAMRMEQPDGRIGHAEVRIGRAAIMLADEFPEIDFRSPESLGGTPVNILVYVEDVDARVGCCAKPIPTLALPLKGREATDQSLRTISRPDQ